MARTRRERHELRADRGFVPGRRAGIIQGTGAGGLGPRWALGGIYYVRVGAESVVVRDVKGHRAAEDLPLVAVDAAGAVVAVGRDAAEKSRGDTAIGLRRPFDREHGGDAKSAAALLKHLIRQLRRVPGVPQLVRGMVIQPAAPELEAVGDEEWTFLLAAAKGAGAMTAQVWVGRDLDDAEVFDAIVPPAYHV